MFYFDGSQTVRSQLDRLAWAAVSLIAITGWWLFLGASMAFASATVSGSLLDARTGAAIRPSLPLAVDGSYVDWYSSTYVVEVPPGTHAITAGAWYSPNKQTKFVTVADGEFVTLDFSLFLDEVGPSIAETSLDESVWYRDPSQMAATFSVEDTETGVFEVYWQLGARTGTTGYLGIPAGTTQYQWTVPLTSGWQEGENLLTFGARDWGEFDCDLPYNTAGDQKRIKMDWTPPTVSGAMMAAPAGGISLSAQDALSGVDKIYWRRQGEVPWQQYVPDPAGDWDWVGPSQIGLNEVEYYATDTAGNASAVQTTSWYTADIAPPVSTAGDLDTGWQTSYAPPVSFWTYDDASGNSTWTYVSVSRDGVSLGETVFYMTDMFYSAIFDEMSPGSLGVGSSGVVEDGRYLVSYYGVDEAGNIEGTRSGWYLVDRQPPSSTAVTTPNGGATTVLLEGTDSTSGIASLTWSLDGGLPQTVDGPSCEIPVSEPGAHTLEFYATDAAGLTETVRVLEFSVAAASVTFADSNLEAAVRTSLGIPQPLPVTHTDMLRLRYFNAEGKGIRRLDGLEHAKNLDHLNLYRNEVSDISPLSGLSSLEWLGIAGNRITDLSPVSGLSSLRYLWVGVTLYAGTESEMELANEVSDLTPLAGMTQLEYLGLSHNPVSDLSSIRNLTRLRQFTCSDTGVQDISVLSGMTELTYLRLGGTAISDISPLSVLTKLEDVVIRDTQVSDISAVRGWLMLRRLSLYSNRISNIASLSENTGIDAGDVVKIDRNFVDLTPGSSGRQTVDELLARGVDLTYEPQNATGDNAAPIHAGTDVQVTAGQATVIFPTVVSPGTLTVTPYAPRHEGPTNFRLLPNLYFDIHPTATFEGLATVTLTVPETYTGDLTRLKVFHWKDSGWETITPTADVQARTLTFQTDSFSDFAVGEPTATGATVGTSASAWWSMAVVGLVGIGLLGGGRRRQSVR